MQLCASFECSDFGQYKMQECGKNYKNQVCALCTAHEALSMTWTEERNRRSKSAWYNFWVWITTQYHIYVCTKEKMFVQKRKICSIQKGNLSTTRVGSGHLEGFSKHIYVSSSSQSLWSSISPHHCTVRTNCPGTLSHLNFILKRNVGLLWTQKSSCIKAKY